MTSKLGTYWSVMHRRASDYAYFRKLQPSVFKIMDGGQSDYQWAREHLPDSLIIARDWAMSEQHQDMLKDPAGTGKRHAQEWSSHQTRLGFDRAKTLVLGINEPKVWDGGVAEALRVYTIAMCDEAKRLDLRVGAMQFSVGWPNNRGGDSDPDWSPWHGVEAAIKRGNHMLVTHEYWADSGPQENWGWWGGRVLKCPWQVPIVIGETGVDMYVKDASGPHADRGWRRHLSPSPYAAQLAEYVGLMAADSRFVGCCVFASDYAAGEWYSFDLEPAYNEILVTDIPDVEPEPGPGPTPPPDPGTIQEGQVTATAGLNVRAEPSTAATKLGALAYQSTVLYDHTENGWHHLADGWVSGEWVGPVVPPGETETLTPSPGVLVHPLPRSVITQDFYEGEDNYIQFGFRGHNGTDFGGRPEGTPIGAMAAGVVLHIGYDERGYGHFVEIAHDALGVATVYCHASEITVDLGQVVNAGDTIALLGSTGNSTGTHLHFEVRALNGYGTYSDITPMAKGRVDPRTWCCLHGLKL